MKQLKTFMFYKRSHMLDHVDTIYLERLIYSVPLLRLLPLKHKIESVSFRLYSSNNHTHWVATVLPQIQIHPYKNVQIIPRNLYSTSNDSRKDDLVKSRSNEKTAVSTTIQQIKRTSETMFWCSVILVGLSFAVCIFYVITNELFSSNSAHRIYSKAFKYVAKDERVLNEMGDQLKGFGEETRRGRRQHVTHVEYTKDGRNYLRMKFNIKGNRGYGSVHLEMIENNKGDYEYRYMFIVVESDPNVYKKTIILEDNRNKYENDGNVGNALEMENLKELDLSTK